jgi:alpha-galactosidase
MIELTNSFLSVQINPGDGSCSIRFPQTDAISIQDARIQATYAQYGKTYRVNTDDGLAVKQAELLELDPRVSAAVQVGYDPRGILLTAVYTVLPDDPFLRIRLLLENRGANSVDVLSLDPFIAGTQAIRSFKPTAMVMQPSGAPLNWFSNSWQSWPQSRTYLSGQKPLGTGIALFQGPDWFNAETPRPRQAGHYSGDFFGVLAHPQSRAALLAGFLSQKEQFGTLECWTRGDPSLRVWANGDSARLDPGTTFTTDEFVLGLLDMDDPDPLGVYLDAVAKENGAAFKSEVPTGWCSWYHFYTKISEKIISDNLHAIEKLKGELPISLIQIDDGFESQIGDWLTFTPDFPHGVAPLADEIRQAGFVPGLWLAPFIVHPKSKLMIEHPDYILRDSDGKPVNSGFNWNVFTTSLDLTHHAALDYACRVVSTAAHEWGFPYLKLDFLFAGARPGVHSNPTLTRAQTLRRAMEAIRHAAGSETTLLGCGAPLGSVLGLVDAMRIGADVSSDWQPKYHGLEYIFPNEPHIPSVRNALQNTVVRAPMHKRWWINDPDCLLVRPETHLTPAELQTHVSLAALTGGSLIFSDDFPRMPAERVKMAQSVLPPIGLRPEVIGLFDESTPHQLRVDLNNSTGPWTMVGLINWEDKPADLVFAPERFGLPVPVLARTWWEDRFLPLSGEPLTFPHVPAHGCVLLAVRQVSPDRPQYMGSSLHISQGMEVNAFTIVKNRVRVDFDLPRSAAGVVDIALPMPVESAEMSGQPVSYSPVAEGIYRFEVAFDHTARLEIKLSRE